MAAENENDEAASGAPEYMVLEDPEVADLATWGVLDPPRYISQLPEAEQEAALERVRVAQAKSGADPSEVAPAQERPESPEGGETP